MFYIKKNYSHRKELFYDADMNEDYMIPATCCNVPINQDSVIKLNINSNNNKAQRFHFQISSTIHKAKK